MREALPIEELESLAKVEIGEALRQTRLHYGQNIEDIEEALCIRSSQIDAIEQGNLSNLPGKAYAIGFVRSYAEYLGLDGDMAVRLFKAQYMDGEVSNESLSFPIPAREAKTPSIGIVVFSALISILFFTGWYSINYSEEISPVLQIQRVPKEIKDHVEKDIMVTMPEINDLSALEPLSGDATALVENMGDEHSQKKGIVLNIISNSWVEVKNKDGNIIVSDFLEKGDQYFVPDNPGLTMSLGNAANVEIIIDGLALKPLGKDGDVRRDIPLNTTYLKTLEFIDTP